jgi:hypothetical protein
MNSLDWNVDGHRILLTVNKSSIDIAPSICPHGAVAGAPCYHQGIDSCLVNYFTNVYGIETNTGTVPAGSSIEIAWCSEGSDWDIDLVEFLMIPVDDPHFKDWLDGVKSSA